MPSQHKTSKVSPGDIEEYRGQLLEWYDRHRRDIPWRAQKGVKPDPYHVWLSEIMCQQTTVQAVKAYYLKFLDKWPRIKDLAAADTEEVMAAWAGLGYYARARNLHKCAKVVTNEMGGVFPQTQEELRKLPGIGDYTSAAMTAIAFNQPATVVDGNVERVVSRLFAVEQPLPASKKQIKALAYEFYKGFKDRPGDLAQAFMDLGAGICIPKSPRCTLCPVAEGCEANKRGIAAELPKKIKKQNKPQRVGNVYWIKNEKGEVLFHRRSEKGLLGGMLGLPTTDWGQKKHPQVHPGYIMQAEPLNVDVHHTFTHFDLKLSIYQAKAKKLPENETYQWLSAENGYEMLPSVFQKVLKVSTGHK